MTAPNGTPNVANGARHGVTLAITLDPDGSVRVQGPIDDKMLCYALLENARDAVKDYGDARRQPVIQAPTSADILSINGKRGR